MVDIRHTAQHSANCLQLYHNRCMTQPKWPKSLAGLRQRQPQRQLSQASWRIRKWSRMSKNEQWKSCALESFLSFCETSWLRVRQPAEVNCLWILRIWEMFHQCLRDDKSFSGSKLLVRSHESLTVQLGSSSNYRRDDVACSGLRFGWAFGDRLDIHPRLSLMVHWPFSFNWWTCGHPVRLQSTIDTLSDIDALHMIRFPRIDTNGIELNATWCLTSFQLSFGSFNFILP